MAYSFQGVHSSVSEFTIQSNKSQMKHSLFIEEKCPCQIMLLLSNFSKIAAVLRNLSNSSKSAFADEKLTSDKFSIRFAQAASRRAYVYNM